MSSTSPQTIRDHFRGAAKSDDRELVWAMVALGVGTLLGAALLSFHAIPYGWVYYIAATYVAGLALLTLATLRLQQHYSLAGIFWFVTSIGLFQLWNSVVMWVSLLSGWWASGQPGYHLVISAAAGLIPLFVGIWQLGRKVSKAS